MAVMGEEGRGPLLMDVSRTVFLREDKLVLIDRRHLPQAAVEVVCSDHEAVAKAIEEMAVQGAGDIAIAAGYGLYLAARRAAESSNCAEAWNFLQEAKQRLTATRPTGYHLAALLGWLLKRVEVGKPNWPEQILAALEQAVENQRKRSRSTGAWAETLLADGDVILTHCFPGAALLYMLQEASAKGKRVEVIATETRPYLQGARLTAWAVSELGIPVTLITDNMAAYCMSIGRITKVFTAADRIALDGTVANKVGTFQLALAACYHRLPFYVLGYGGPDSHCATGKDIPIEMRDPEEVLCFNGKRITGDKVKGFYPAFDLTPPALITGIVTDRGIFAAERISEYRTLNPGSHST